jgi:hypothetical protein
MSGVTYKLSFSGGPTVKTVSANIGANSVDLEAGTYTVTATAYAGGESAIAEGTAANVTVSSGGTSPVSITMGPKTGGGNGTFSYAITWPGEVTSAGLVITPKAGGSPTTVNLKTLSTPGTGTATLAPGYYDVTVSVVKGGKTAGDSEVIHLYSGLTSSWTMAYEESRFSPEMEAQAVSIDFGQGNIISLVGYTGDLAIQKGGSSVTLTVEGYTDVSWKVDGVQKETGASFTLDQDDYDVRTHSLTVIGTKGGKPYALNLAFTVTAGESGGGQGPVSAAGLAAYLAAIPADKGNSADDPYTVALDATVDVASSTVWGGTIKDALANSTKYITLDLSRCYATENTISGFQTPTTSHFNIVNKTHIIGIILPDTLTSIGQETLRDWPSLKDVTIGSSVTSIGNGVFYNDSGLSEIIIPSSVQTIGTSAFRNTGLTSVIIPASVTSIANNAFRECANLTIVTFLGNNTELGGSNSFDNSFKTFYDSQSSKAGTYTWNGTTWTNQ